MDATLYLDPSLALVERSVDTGLSPSFSLSAGFGGMLTYRTKVNCAPDGDDRNICGNKKKDPPKDPDCPGGPPKSPKNPDKDKDGKTQESQTDAFSDQNVKGYSQIMFCNRFFNNLNALDEVIASAKKRSKTSDLWAFQNRPRVVFHEITHLAYFMNAPEQSPYVKDVRISYKENGKRGETSGASYGPERVKILANYERVEKGGFYTQQNGKSTIDCH